MKFEFDEASVREFYAKLKNISEDLAEYYADAIADHILKMAQEYLENGPLANSRNPFNGAYDTGELANSGVVLNEGEGRRVIGFAADHAPYIEFGTVPHWIPTRPLKEWAKRNKIKDIWPVIKGIQKRVAKEGTPPKPFLRQAIEHAISHLDEIVDETIREFIS